MPNEIRITRRIAATPDEVFDAWTDPASLMEWMVPIPGGSTAALLDPRVGGRFQIEMRGAGRVHRHDGEYLRLDRPRLLEFTWASDATQGVRSVVTVELRPVGKGETELTLIHKLLPSEQSASAHREGWNTGLARLAERFS